MFKCKAFGKVLYQTKLCTMMTKTTSSKYREFYKTVERTQWISCCYLTLAKNMIMHTIRDIQNKIDRVKNYTEVEKMLNSFQYDKRYYKTELWVSRCCAQHTSYRNGWMYWMQ